MNGSVIKNTQSVCPVCLKQTEARLVRNEDGIFICKTCADHGEFETLVWRDLLDFDKWVGDIPEVPQHVRCPSDCGLCANHLRATCCTVLELTDRCNLNCTYCFAGEKHGPDRPLQEIKADIKALTVPGKTLVQLSGGEPTLRDDLPEIVEYAKECGCKYVQLNSNGIRLGEYEEFVIRLAKAGLSFVFMQFDGTNDAINEALRGKPLMKQKLQAIANCAKHNLGVVLVATVVNGINDANIGELIKFAVAMSPTVRGVHFQPVSYFGRYPNKPDNLSRMTLDKLVVEIETQTGGLVKRENIAPSRCDHPLCGFHGDFIVMPDGLKALTRADETKLRCDVDADQNREFVGRRWQKPERDCCCGSDIKSFDGFLERARVYGFTLTCMPFQDCYTFDIERLKQCSTHVFKSGKFIPLCAYYLTGE